MDYISAERSPLSSIESRMREVTPAKLYADAWINPTSRNFVRVFNHLRTLYRILYNYLPRQIVSSLPEQGVNRYLWEEGTLMFTDLAGFTPLLEKNSQAGQEGAEALHKVLNSYFSEMIQIVSKSGGNLLEFTGDALLIQFPTDHRKQDTNRAVRAGLRMQRAMEQFAKIELLGEEFALGMRIGVHVGNYLTADIGTPHRMEHVLLSRALLDAKQAESRGEKGFVCLTPAARERLGEDFRFKEGQDGHFLVVDDFTEKDLGDYDIIPPRSRMASMVMLDNSMEGLIEAISEAIDRVEPLASFIPRPVLNLLVENASARGLPPDFPEATVLFINLLGMPENLEALGPEAQNELVSNFSRIISVINAEIETHGGVMKKVTYHHAGPDIMAFFGVPNAHTNDSERAVRAATGIQSLIKQMDELELDGTKYKITGHIGLNRGQVFAAEIGDKQGRREFNVLGNPVNTAARLMDYADANQIIASQSVFDDIRDTCKTKKHAKVQLKGRSQKIDLYEILGTEI